MGDPSERKILILDDDPFMLKLFACMLGNLGFTRVTLCESGQAALDCIDDPERRPELILCDLNMPEMDGIAFVGKLVDHAYPGSLILASGEDKRILKSTEKLVKAHRIPLLGCLQKPVSPDKLARTLEKWLPASAQARARVKLYSAEELKAAITGGELVNFYQPKVVVATGQVVGVETLVRWNHPRDGMVYPDSFIAVAEASGLMDELTCAVLREALAQARLWHDAGLGLRVAVNLSMDSLSAPGFADLVAGLTAASGLPPQELVLEVTESRLMGDLRVPLEALTRLRMKRFHLSIDDFGTGHSSLAQLRDIPFDELKIDQSFVHGAWADDTIRALYDASLNLAQQLEMQVVAEGVEDQEDWDFLGRTGCQLAQGYFIARPMPAASLEAWLEARAGQPLTPPSTTAPEAITP